MKNFLGSLTPSRLCVAAACCFIMLPAVPSRADGIPAFSFTSANFAASDNSTAELGYNFTTGNDPILVDALGYINDGFNGTHTVAIFNVATQQLVSGASATVTTVGGGSTSNTFTYTNLSSPVTLAANTQYQIISQFYSNEHYFFKATGFTAQPGLTLDITAVGFFGAPPASPEFATGTFAPTVPGDFGPNFTIGSAPAPVPEPSSIYLIASGLLGAGITLRRRLS